MTLEEDILPKSREIRVPALVFVFLQQAGGRSGGGQAAFSRSLLWVQVQNPFSFQIFQKH